MYRRKATERKNSLAGEGLRLLLFFACFFSCNMVAYNNAAAGKKCFCSRILLECVHETMASSRAEARNHDECKI